MLWVTSVLLPVLFVLVMTGVETLAEPYVAAQDRAFRIGWDLCVLALGVAGSVFSLPQIISAYSPELAVVLGWLSMALSLGGAVVIAHLKRTRVFPAARTCASVLIGGGALVLPSYALLNV